MIGSQLYTDLSLNLNHSPGRNIAMPDEGVIPQEDPDKLIDLAYREFLELPGKLGRMVTDQRKSMANSPAINGEYILNPAQINTLYTRMIGYLRTPHSKKQGRDFLPDGVFISGIIQKSYESGLYNDFVLTTGRYHSEGLGYMLRGQEDRRLNLKIEGAAGSYTAHNCWGLNLTVTDDVSHHFGKSLFGSDVILMGQKNDHSSMTQDTMNCRFRVVEEYTYDYLCRYLTGINKVILIDKTGKSLGSQDVVKRQRWSI